MSLFLDEDQFQPERDGKIPARRTAFALVVRGAGHVLGMLFSRHPADALRWAWSMWCRRKPLSYALPWITFDAIREVEQRVHSGQRVFEYGAGHSTVYWVTRGVELSSVEDNAEWFAMVKKAVGDSPGISLSFETVKEEYVGKIDAFPGQFDVVVVDGSHRKACIAAAVPKLKSGGLLIVDNTDWHWMSRGDLPIPSDWTKRVHSGSAPFIGHTSQTTIWQRP